MADHEDQDIATGSNFEAHARGPAGSPVMLEILRTLATPAEVAFLTARVFHDAGLDPGRFPRAAESMAFLAGMAARSRNAGTPFEATWSLVSERKGLDALAAPEGRAFWDRVRRAMKAIASAAPGDFEEENREFSSLPLKAS